MLILFEGLDKSGKSTLIKNFQDISKLPVFKNDIKPTPAAFDRGMVNGIYYGAYKAADLSLGDTIFDRSHITELTYANVKRGYWPEEGFWLDWEEKNQHKVFTVYVDTPTELLIERFEKDKEEYVKVEEIEAIKKAYEEYFKKSKLSLVYVDGSLDRQRMLTYVVIQLQNLGVWSTMRHR